MTSTSDQTDKNTGIDELLNEHFAGRVVRKDLTKLVKEGANVPVYVLEYLLGNYCASNDEAVIEDGLKTVKKVLADNYVRPDEAEKVKSTIRERGSLRSLTRLRSRLMRSGTCMKHCCRILAPRASRFQLLQLRIEKLLAGGIWSIITMRYVYEEGQKGSPFVIEELKPIQMPNMDMEELFAGRKYFFLNHSGSMCSFVRVAMSQHNLKNV